MKKVGNGYAHALLLKMFTDWTIYEYLENNSYNMVLTWVFSTFLRFSGTYYIFLIKTLSLFKNTRKHMSSIDISIKESPLKRAK